MNSIRKIAKYNTFNARYLVQKPTYSHTIHRRNRLKLQRSELPVKKEVNDEYLPLNMKITLFAMFWVLYFLCREGDYE